MRSFIQKLTDVQAITKSYWALYISPDVEKLPIEIQRYDDPYLPYMRAIYQATQHLVCAYVLDFGAYLRLGAAGAVALERSIDLIGDTHITILDTAIASTRYVGLWEETAYGCDALTIANTDVLPVYQKREDRAAYLIATGEMDRRPMPTYWADARIFSIDRQQVRLLSEDTLVRARSLTFGETLQAIVSEGIYG